MSTDDRSNPMFVREPEPKDFYRVDRPDPQLGFPELWWRGKRPFDGTPYYPAQHKESHGEPVNGWQNKLYWGDNLQVMGHLLRKERGRVRLVYLDPPFDSKADYKRKIELKGQGISSDRSGFEEKQYGDIWTNDEYLQFMYDRLVLARELLTDDGSIYLHVGPNVSHYLRIVLDEVFGRNNHVNEIIWRRAFGHSDSDKCGIIHDAILLYGKGPQRVWNKVTHAPDKEYIETFFDCYDEVRKERYQRLSLSAGGLTGGGYVYEYKGVRTNWRCPLSTLEKHDAQGRLHWPSKAGGVPRLKKYESEYEGAPLQDLWTDISKIHNQSSEATGYPTQKPEALLERIIRASSDPGDLVFDCFMGSGTTQAVAMKLGRRFIGADINLGSIQTVTKRLIGVADTLRQGASLLPRAETGAVYTGFEVHTVNQYDVFRNELEARALLMEALAIRPLPGGDVWHGELGEGSETRLVRFMPINRIATRADLDPIIKNLDWKALTRRRADLPNKPVLRASLVCMGHEPELAGLLALEIRKGLGDGGAKLDIEVVDILRDKDHIEFKRDSHAQVRLRRGKVVIEKFYPMNLLQKLSLDKTAVEDWRELVESVFVDFNYDGKVLKPSITDVAEGKTLVKGEYDVPKSAGVIRVKITDLLSDVLELNVEVEHA